ncbi:fatty-acyl-CoA synthase [Rhodoligotrophos appendicifer]|uniref:class I adenylate-forming enzyme family protein n=1 Tax=Rhodoligotrophos appendicifer TaxID=987056 RepID=UPI00118521F1|nr:AMP-binding protein [Rhodoligotrophos appendicifer]
MGEWYPKKRIGDLPAEMARRFGGREGLRYGNRCYSFSEMAAEVELAARALMGLGVEKGDHVALWLNNRADWIFIQYAIAQIGAVLVPVNPRFRTGDLAYLLRQSDSTVLITHRISGPIDYLDVTRQVVQLPDEGVEVDDQNFPRLRKVVILDEDVHKGTVSWNAAKADATRVSQQSLEERARSVDPDDMCLILYTSGSTGFPKGVMHTHILLRSLEQRAFRFNLTDRDVIINYLPLSHAFGLSEGSLMSMVSGARQILTETFDPDEALDLIERERVTITHGFDTHMSMLMDAQERKPRDISSLRFGWLPAGPSNVVPIAYRARRILAPLKTFSGFGMTETWTGACIGSLDDTDEQLCEASGVPALGFEVRIIDPATGAQVPAEVPGEIQIRGFAVTKGYYNMPKETQAIFTDDGWLKTGDMGYFRKDGLLRFFGRFKDMLKVGGENVDPLEIEAHLLKSSQIQQVSVVGLPDKKLSEVPVAYVQVRKGVPAAEADIIGLCRHSMASFKIPRHVVFVEDFPMTASGKIRKMDLRADAVRRFAPQAG